MERVRQKNDERLKIACGRLMPTLLPGTTFLIDVLNDRRGRADLMERMILEQHTIACCAINVAEVCVGLRVSEARETETLLRQLACMPIRREAAKLAGDLKREWTRQGRAKDIP